MKNIDEIINKSKLAMADLVKALKDENQTNEDIANSFENLVKAKLEEYQFDIENSNNDNAILASRGIRMLTSEEKQYYNKVSTAMINDALTGVKETMPTTVFESVFEDIKNNSELLSLINMVNTTGITEMVVASGDKAPAWWGTLDAAIQKQLAAAFAKVPVNQLKLSAYLPIAKSMLILGANWLDRFIREVLTAAAVDGLVKGIVCGTGNNEPIGMIRDLDGAVTSGVYAKKTAVALTEFSPEGIADILVALSKSGARAVGGLVMCVNPIDLFTKINPAIKNLVNGVWVEVLPHDITFIPVGDLARNEAVIGIAKKYFLGVGSDRVIDYSDHFKFLDDERTYITKILANGKPKDNDSFVVVDITNLKKVVPYEINTTNNITVESTPVV